VDASVRPTVQHRFLPSTPAEPGAARRLALTLAVAAAPMLLAVLFGLRHEFSPAAYLPLHSVVEMFIAFVGFATFAVQWYAAGARGVREARGRFLGAASLAMAGLEVAHTLVFPGMPGFLGPSTVERGIHYWIAARVVMTTALVASAFVPARVEHRLFRRGPLALGAVALVAAFVALEIRLPSTHGLLHATGTGLTGLKVAIEIVLGVAASAGAWIHLRRYRTTGDATLLRTAAALGWLVLAAVCLTGYASAYDSFNLLGHGYAAAASWIIFHALFVAALLRPYERLDETSRDLARSNARLEALRAHVEGELASSIARLEETGSAADKARGELEAAVAAVPDGIVRYAPDGSIVSMNVGAERLLVYGGRAQDVPLEARWAALRARKADGTPLPFAENPIARALRGEVVQGMSLVISPADRPRWVNVSAAPILGPGGALAGAVSVFTDVSELQELQAEREDLLRAVSHDLRNPLQIVLLQAERIQRLAPPDGVKERKAGATIASAAKQMGVMIRDLVEAVRLEAQLVLRPEPLDLARWVPDRLALTAGVLDMARVHYDLDPGLPPVHADASRLERVLTNLVGNALKYSTAPAPVRISAALQEDAVVISVADGGVGIAPEDVPRLFQRFQRGRLTQRTEGLGLGLYIVRALVEAHGGRVWVESVPGEGSTFSFTLPLASAAERPPSPMAR
jgi:signal transduction histidine kinase